MTDSVQIPLYRGTKEVVAYALVDRTDADEVMKHQWHLLKLGLHTILMYAVRYERRQGKKSLVLMHRVILGLTPADKLEVDHINHNGLDNRRENVRAVTHAQNQQNKRRNKTGSSQFRGVRWKCGKWEAFAHVDNRLYHLGYFTKEQEAAVTAAAFRAKHMPYSLDAIRAAQ